MILRYKKILLVVAATMVLFLGSCATAKDYTAEKDNDFDMVARFRQGIPEPERPAKIKEAIRQLKENGNPIWPAGVDLVALDAKEAIPELMNLLDNEHQCLVVISILSRLGAKEAIPKIMTLLNNQYAEIRRAAVRALGHLGAKEAIPELTKLLNDESSQMRLSAACALGNLGVKDRAIPELIKLLNTVERLSAIRALGKLNARESIPELIKLLNDDDRQVRQAAGDALGQLDDREAIPELTKLPMIIDEDGIYGRTNSLWSHKQALVINPADASAYYFMGFIYDERFNNPSKAIFCYTKYLELAPPDAPDRERVKKWVENCRKRINYSFSNKQSIIEKAK